jgi:hypothetical protein
MVMNPAVFCENPGELMMNPAVFCENPAEIVTNPAVFSHNPAGFANNPADSGKNPAVLLLLPILTPTLIPAYCQSSFGYNLCCSDMRISMCMTYQESHLPSLNKR